MIRRRLWVSLTLTAWMAAPPAAQAPLPITGLWHFDWDFGATVGTAIEPQGAVPFAFGRCSDWKLPLIAGSDEGIVRLGRPERPSSESLLRLYPGSEPNGGGRRVNEYTLVMDVLFTSPFGPDGWTAILNLDGANRRFDQLWYRGPATAAGQAPAHGQAPGQGAGVVSSGFKSSAERSVPADTWVRLTYRVSVRNHRLHEDFFLDGANVSIKSADANPLDERGSAPARSDEHPFIAFWAHPYADANAHGTAYLNSVAFFGRPLSDQTIAGLAGPAAGGIPRAIAPASAAAVTDSTLAPRKPASGAHLTVSPQLVAPVRLDASRSFTATPVPGSVGAPYYATHDGSEAVLVDGEDVYFAYFGNGSHLVKRDGQSGRWEGPVFLGGMSRDPYRYPEIAMGRDGHLHVFYGGHDSAGAKNGFLYRRSVAPRDVRAWTAETMIGRDASFPKPYALADGRLLLFSRGSSDAGPGEARRHGWGYVESGDGGRTWAPFRRLVDGKNVLYGGGKLVQEPGGRVIMHWAWGWWDEGVCDLGQYYSPNIAVPCKYDGLEYAAFPVGADAYRDAEGVQHALPFTRGAIAPLSNREWLIVADSALDAEGNPVIPFGDYERRQQGRLLLATHTKSEGWIIEDPFPDMDIAFNNLRVRNVGGWITIVGLAVGKDPGLFVAQRKGRHDRFYVRQITHQAFPFQMHPIFKEDEANGLLHIFFAEGDRLSSSRIMYGALPIDPLAPAPAKRP